MRLLTPREAARRAVPLHLIFMIVLAVLGAGVIIGNTSRLPWEQDMTFGDPLAMPASKAWLGPRKTFLKRRCEDSCLGRTRNGVCDDGRPTVRYKKELQQHPRYTTYQVHCDLGTDCSDCGAWYHNNANEAENWAPVRELRRMNANFSLYTRVSPNPQPFWMAFAEGGEDRGVSAYIQKHGIYEHGHTWAWHNLLRECILPGPDKGAASRQLVVDVGANFGYYSLLAASMGCRVVAWEPVPYFAAYFKYALLRNNMTHAVALRDTIAGSEAGELTIQAPLRGAWGAAGVDGNNIEPQIPVMMSITQRVERVDAVVHEPALILKANVEGHEASVLRSAKRLLLKHGVKHIFVDYSPGIAERRKDWAAAEANPATLIGLLRARYTILHLPADFREGSSPEWAGVKSLPHMEELTEAVLRYDVLDVQRMREGSLGCPPVPELKQRNLTLFACGAVPEALDPYSFRAAFLHSAQLWAFKQQPWFANIGAPAALVPLAYDVKHSFFVKGGRHGMGRRPCLELQPDQQVPHRCACTAKEVCGELEAAVSELARQGKLPPFPLQTQQRNAGEAALSIASW